VAYAPACVGERMSRDPQGVAPGSAPTPVPRRPAFVAGRKSFPLHGLQPEAGDNQGDTSGDTAVQPLL
jgi:hypothetical protein